MGFRLALSTPHGIELEDAYANIDYFAYTARAGEIIFNFVFYKNKEAREQNLAALPDMIISGNVPAENFDFSGDIKAQIYEYVKAQAMALAPDPEDAPESFSSILAGTEEEVQQKLLMQYSIFRNAEDVIDQQEEE